MKMYLKHVPFGGLSGMALSPSKDKVEVSYDGSGYKVSPSLDNLSYTLMHTYDYVGMKVLGTLYLTD
jgi:hypothetical protein